MIYSTAILYLFGFYITRTVKKTSAWLYSSQGTTFSSSQAFTCIDDKIANTSAEMNKILYAISDFENSQNDPVTTKATQKLKMIMENAVYYATKIAVKATIRGVLVGHDKD